VGSPGRRDQLSSERRTTQAVPGFGVGRQVPFHPQPDLHHGRSRLPRLGILSPVDDRLQRPAKISVHETW